MSKRLIYAEDAIKALEALFVKQIKQFGYDSYEKADEKTQLVCDGISYSIGCVLDLPSAQPRMKGKWVRKESDLSWWYECSECGESPLFDPYADEVQSPFCPWCGAEMETEQQ